MLDQGHYRKVDKIIEERGQKPSSLIAIIQDISSEEGYLPPELLLYVADKIGVSEAKAFSVATFYENFSFEPKGKYVIKSCDGTACHIRKSAAIMQRMRDDLGLKDGQNTTDDMKFTLETVACLGACGLAPVVTVNGEVHPSMTPDEASALIAKLKKEG